MVLIAGRSVYVKRMGQLASVIRALDVCACDSCAKFVFNDCHCRSSCRDFCEFEFETSEVELPDDDSTYSVDIVGCCGARKT